MSDDDSSILPGLDPDVRERVVTVEAVTTNLGRMQHSAKARTSIPTPLTTSPPPSACEC
jgi:hypothetical protein